MAESYKQKDKYSWMGKTKGGKRTSEYTSTKKKPKKPNVIKGNIYEKVRERANRYKDL